MDYISLISLGISFLSQIIPSLTKAKAPQEIIDAIGDVVNKLELHKADVISKQALEAQRG